MELAAGFGAFGCAEKPASSITSPAMMQAS
jgi:hypothetical protein